MSTFMPNRRVQRRFNQLLFVLFLAGIWAPLGTMLVRGTADAGPHGTENRARAEFPELTGRWESFRTFPDRYELYIDNQFGLRDTLIRLHSRLCVALYRMSPSPKVRLGRNQWLYFDGDPASDDGSPIQDYAGLNPLTAGQREFLRFMYQDQSDFLKARGIHYQLVLIPTKPFIHPEHLPANVLRARETSWREQLVDHLRAHTDVNVLDLGPALREARKKEAEPLYFRTDTHWNPIGGFVGATEIIRALQPHFPQLEPRPESLYERRPGVEKQGDLARMMSLEHTFQETYVDLVPGPNARATHQKQSEHEFAAIAGGNGDPGSPTAQVYRDSYAEYLYPFLSEYFREVGYAWGQKGTRMPGIETLRPDLVLQISCDRILGSRLSMAPRIQEEGSRTRFDRARPIARFSPADGWDELHISPRARSRVVADGLAVYADRHPATVTLPLPVDPATTLPILRLEIRPENPGPLEVTSPRLPVLRGMPPPEIGQGRFRLENGRNVIHLTLTDPEIRDHVTLNFGSEPGGWLLHAVELRALPRFPGPE